VRLLLLGRLFLLHAKPQIRKPTANGM